MISFLASVISAGKRFPAHEITNVPAVFIRWFLFRSFLSLPPYPSEGCERTAFPVALMFTAAAQRRTLPITEDFRVRPTLVSVAFYVLCGGTAPTRPDYLDPASRARPSVTWRGAGMRAAVKRLHAERIASWYRILACCSREIASGREKWSLGWGYFVSPARTVGSDRRSSRTGGRFEGRYVTWFRTFVYATVEKPRKSSIMGSDARE